MAHIHRPLESSDLTAFSDTHNIVKFITSIMVIKEIAFSKVTFAVLMISWLGQFWRYNFQQIVCHRGWSVIWQHACSSFLDCDSIFWCKFGAWNASYLATIQIRSRRALTKVAATIFIPAKMSTAVAFSSTRRFYARWLTRWLDGLYKMT